MAGCSITFKSNVKSSLANKMFPDVKSELGWNGTVTLRKGTGKLAPIIKKTVDVTVKEALALGLKEALVELKEIATSVIYDKGKRGFTSVTGNLIAGMGATLLTYNSDTGKSSARMPAGMIVPIADGGYGRPLREALGMVNGKMETFWLKEWGTYEGGDLRIPAIVKYHDGTEIRSVRNKDYKGLYLSRPVWFNKRLYTAETDAHGLKGHIERAKYAQSLKNKMPKSSRTMVRMEFFSAMPYTEFVDQQKGYHFMEAIRDGLQEESLYVFAKHFKLKK